MNSKFFADLNKATVRQTTHPKVKVALRSGMEFNGTLGEFSQGEGWVELDKTVISVEEIAAYSIDGGL